MRTILLLIFSNVFMTFAWYGHLKYGHTWPLWKAIVVSWAIALIEYCLAVPANRLGYGQFSRPRSLSTAAKRPYFKCPYQAKVMKTFEKISRRMVLMGLDSEIVYRVSPEIGRASCRERG